MAHLYNPSRPGPGYHTNDRGELQRNSSRTIMTEPGYDTASDAALTRRALLPPVGRSAVSGKGIVTPFEPFLRRGTSREQMQPRLPTTGATGAGGWAPWALSSNVTALGLGTLNETINRTALATLGLMGVGLYLVHRALRG